MKPPARKRSKPDRNLAPVAPQAPEPPRATGKQWSCLEQRNLLKALKASHRSGRGSRDLDPAYLKRYVPTRSVSEVQAVVEYLKDSVISLASFKLKKTTREEKKVRKPIELWTSMASAVAGTREEPICAAFAQMLIVSSTEPCTLRNCDPPQIHRPPTDRPLGRTVPLRPMPRLPVKVERPGTSAARPVVVPKTPGPVMSPARRLPAPSQVVRVVNSKIPPPQLRLSTTAAAISCQLGAAAKILSTPAPPPQPASQTETPVTRHDTPGSGSSAVVKTLIQTTQQSSEQCPTTISTGSTSKSTSSGSHASLSSSSPVPGTAPPSVPPSVPPKPSLSTPAAAFHAKFGRTNKYATKDSPRVFGVKSVVDFERIYRYLSGIHQPNSDCHLTPMESAIVLDLLMSLPEELPLLDCNKLHKHLIQVYQCLSSTADSKMAGEMFKELKDGLHPRQQSADGVTASGGKKPQPDEAESQSGDAEEMGLGCPALNPFMVPLKLLMRK